MTKVTEPTPCPECEFVGKNLQSMAMHRTRTHGYRSETPSAIAARTRKAAQKKILAASRPKARSGTVRVNGNTHHAQERIVLRELWHDDDKMLMIDDESGRFVLGRFVDF